MRWAELPIYIRGRMRQREGWSAKGRDEQNRGYDQANIRPLQFGDSARSLSRKHLMWGSGLKVLERKPDRMGVVLFLIDLSASQMMGTTRTKRETVTDIATGLGIAFISRGHTARYIAFTDRIEAESRMINSRHQWESEVDELEAISLQGTGTDVRRALSHVQVLHEERPLDMVCVVSDFLFEDECRQQFRHLSDDTDLVAICISDPMEQASPPIAGTFVFTDVETGRTMYSSGVTSSDPASYLDKLAIDYCRISTEDSEDRQFTRLTEFFLERVETENE